MTIVTGQPIRASDFTGMIMLFGSSTPPTGFLNCDGSAVSRTTYSGLFAVIGTNYGAGDGSTTFNLPNLLGRMPLGVGTNTFTTTFASTSVDVGTNVITVPSNTSLYDGTKVRLTTTGALPTGLSLATDYYVIRLSATTIQLASSLANAIGNGGTGSAGTVTAIDITAQGSGTNTITVQDLSTRTMGERGGEEKRSLSIAEMPSHSHEHGLNASIDNNDASLNSKNAQNTGSTGGSTPHNVMNPYTVVNYMIKT